MKHRNDENSQSELYEGVDVRLLVPPRPGARALDFGSGSGMVSVTLLAAGFNVVAVDVDPASEERVRRQLNAESRARFQFLLLDPLNPDQLPDLIEGNEFDLAVCREVLEHVGNPMAVLRAVSRAMRIGGRFVVSFPDARSEALFRAMDPAWMRKCEHLRIIHPGRFAAQAREAGFRVVDTYGHGAEWTLLWILLAPLRTDHVMGNPVGPFANASMRVANTVRKLRRIPAAAQVIDRHLPKSRFFVLEKIEAPSPTQAPAKPLTVLVVYDFRDWILRLWADEIGRAWPGRVRVVRMSMFEAQSSPRTLDEMISGADVVHMLLPHATAVMNEVIDDRFIATVHHWTRFETVEPTIRRVREIVTGAREWADHLAGQGVAPDRVTVVHSGAPAHFFDAGRTRVLNPSRLQIRAGFFAKHTSNEDDRKGIRHFEQVVEHTLVGPQPAGVEWVITGPGWDDVVARLRARGARVDYRAHVPAEAMADLYCSLDVYLMLSDVEGGPATIGESMATRCVVISTRIGLARDVIVDGRNGFFVDNTHHAGIAELLLRLRRSPALRRTVGDCAWKTADSELRYAASLAPLADLYERVALRSDGLRSRSWTDEQVAALNSRSDQRSPSVWDEPIGNSGLTSRIGRALRKLGAMRS